jgi:hypothetical protein
MQVPIGYFSVFGPQEKQQQVHVRTPPFQYLVAEAESASGRVKQCECMLLHDWLLHVGLLFPV